MGCRRELAAAAEGAQCSHALESLLHKEESLMQQAQFQYSEAQCGGCSAHNKRGAGVLKVTRGCGLEIGEMKGETGGREALDVGGDHVECRSNPETKNGTLGLEEELREAVRMHNATYAMDLVF